MRIVVETYVMATGKLESSRTINNLVRDNRIWLGKHCVWAFANGRGVQTYNEQDRKAEAA
jgi:hypothetical protein